MIVVAVDFLRRMLNGDEYNIDTETVDVDVDVDEIVAAATKA